MAPKALYIHSVFVQPKWKSLKRVKEEVIEDFYRVVELPVEDEATLFYVVRVPNELPRSKVYKYTQPYLRDTDVNFKVLGLPILSTSHGAISFDLILPYKAHPREIKEVFTSTLQDRIGVEVPFEFKIIEDAIRFHKEDYKE